MWRFASMCQSSPHCPWIALWMDNGFQWELSACGSEISEPLSRESAAWDGEHDAHTYWAQQSHMASGTGLPGHRGVVGAGRKLDKESKRRGGKRCPRMTDITNGPLRR